jgi:hypothetical protein
MCSRLNHKQCLIQTRYVESQFAQTHTELQSFHGYHISNHYWLCLSRARTGVFFTSVRVQMHV